VKLVGVVIALPIDVHNNLEGLTDCERSKLESLGTLDRVGLGQEAAFRVVLLEEIQGDGNGLGQNEIRVGRVSLDVNGDLNTRGGGEFI
jgi:hypothetical protein